MALPIPNPTDELPTTGEGDFVAPTSASGMRLATALPNRDLRVTHVTGNDRDMVRLKRMGIFEGSPIRLAQAGDPLIVLAVGARVGLSRRLADQVFVQTEN